MSANGGFFEPEPPTPRNKPAKHEIPQLPYTFIWTELLKIGVSWVDAMRMPWGVAQMLIYSRVDDTQQNPNGIRDATPEDIRNWI